MREEHRNSTEALQRELRIVKSDNAALIERTETVRPRTTRAKRGGARSPASGAVWWSGSEAARAAPAAEAGRPPARRPPARRLRAKATMRPATCAGTCGAWRKRSRPCFETCSSRCADPPAPRTPDPRRAPPLRRRPLRRRPLRRRRRRRRLRARGRRRAPRPPTPNAGPQAKEGSRPRRRARSRWPRRGRHRARRHAGQGCARRRLCEGS